MEQNRFKSKALWLSVTALIAFVLGQYGLYDAIGMDATAFKIFVDLVLVVAISFGIVNNPTDKENF